MGVSADCVKLRTSCISTTSCLFQRVVRPLQLKTFNCSARAITCRSETESNESRPTGALQRTRLLRPFGDSLLPLLKDYLPEYEWLEWRFQQVPKGFWDKQANRRRYLDRLGQQLGIKQPEDWYQLSIQQLGRWH